MFSSLISTRFKIKRLNLNYKQTPYHIAAYLDEAKIKSDTIAGGVFAADGKILDIGYLVLEKRGVSPF